MQVRDELIDAVCKREMGVYTQIFSAMGETAKLERTVNRCGALLEGVPRASLGGLAQSEACVTKARA